MKIQVFPSLVKQVDGNTAKSSGTRETYQRLPYECYPSVLLKKKKERVLLSKRFRYYCSHLYVTAFDVRTVRGVNVGLGLNSSKKYTRWERNEQTG